MLIVIGLVILVAAVIAGVAGVLGNGGSGHALWSPVCAIRRTGGAYTGSVAPDPSSCGRKYGGCAGSRSFLFRARTGAG